MWSDSEGQSNHTRHVGGHAGEISTQNFDTHKENSQGGMDDLDIMCGSALVESQSSLISHGDSALIC